MIKKQHETEKDLNVTQGVRELAARPASARLLEAARKRSLQPMKRRPKDSPGPTSCGRFSDGTSLPAKRRTPS